MCPARGEAAPLVRALEVRRVGIDRPGRIDAVIPALQHDAGHGDVGLRRQARLDRIKGWVARYAAELVPVGMDHHVDEIGIVERNLAALEGRSSKVQLGDHSLHNSRQSARRLADRPARPRSE